MGGMYQREVSALYALRMPDTTRRTPEGLKRLIAFADAVVAIAMTLLVLPLADLAANLQEQRTLTQALAAHGNVLLGFFISFSVTWVLWRNHHRIMEQYRIYDDGLFYLHYVWLFTIVLLPLATALISNEHVHWADGFYIVVLAVSVGALIGISRSGIRNPGLLADGARVRTGLAGWSGVGTVAALVVALAITLLWPAVGSWPLLLLAIPGPLEAVLVRLRGR